VLALENSDLLALRHPNANGGASSGVNGRVVIGAIVKDGQRHFRVGRPPK
jgi:hypothetical protein